MTILLTGAAGFIGFHCAKALLQRGETILGLDNLNAYYSVELKKARLAELSKFERFEFKQVDIADHSSLAEAVRGVAIGGVLHLAARAGARHALHDPRSYIRSNLVGHANVLELCRGFDGLGHLVYASSSSVYGANALLPYRESDRVDDPLSLYAATKRSCELLSRVYADLHWLPQSGLRFFTVYGPWGRPDMAYWTFTEAILKGDPVRIFSRGDTSRDFTFIDDAVDAVLAVADNPPPDDASPPHRVVNVGCGKAESVLVMVRILEDALGKKANRVMEPEQPGEVKATAANISLLKSEFGFTPKVRLEEGLPRFVRWYKQHHGCG